MSYFAQIDENNIVRRVVVADHDFVESGKLGDPRSFVECSYHTKGGQLKGDSKGHSKMRKNYPGVGYAFNPQLDAFVPPKNKNRDDATFDEQKGLWMYPRVEEAWEKGEKQ